MVQMVRMVRMVRSLADRTVQLWRRPGRPDRGGQRRRREAAEPVVAGGGVGRGREDLDKDTSE